MKLDFQCLTLPASFAAVLDAHNFFIASALFGYFLDAHPGIFVHCVFLIFLDYAV